MIILFLGNYFFDKNLKMTIWEKKIALIIIRNYIKYKNYVLLNFIFKWFQPVCHKYLIKISRYVPYGSN